MGDTGEDVDSSLGKDQVVTASCLLSLRMVERIPESLLICSPGKHMGMGSVNFGWTAQPYPQAVQLCAAEAGEGAQCPLLMTFP